MVKILIVHSRNTISANQDYFSILLGFLGGSDGKESACNAGDLGSIPGLGRSSGEEYPGQYSCLGIPMDRGAWQKEPDTAE